MIRDPSWKTNPDIVADESFAEIYTEEEGNENDDLRD